MRERSLKNRPFIDEFIPKVSRTFALTIKFLPRALRDSIYSSYLLCRVADTLEDSPFLDIEQKKDRLTRLSSMLYEASEGTGFPASDLPRLYGNIDPGSGDDHRLLVESSKLFDILESLPDYQQKVIFRRAGEMAEGMAQYVELHYLENEKIGALKDIADWDRYCYYVAGTVGHMLTEIFARHYDLNKSKTDKLTELSSSFGLGLQKVNVIKDVPEDRKRGVCYLPLDIMKNYGLKPSSLDSTDDVLGIEKFVEELAANAMSHLDDAIAYTALIPHGYKGVRMFLLVPVLLAVETMNLVITDPVRSMAGPPVKLTRTDVARLVGAASLRISSNKSIMEFYGKIRSATA